MENIKENITELQTYLKKLKNIIETEASFSFGNTKIVNKKKIDDVLCCVEANIPNMYKAYLKKGGPRKLTSNTYYSQLLYSIKNKFFFSTNVYKVESTNSIKCIDTLIETLASDIKFVYSNESGMF